MGASSIASGRNPSKLIMITRLINGSGVGVVVGDGIMVGVVVEDGMAVNVTVGGIGVDTGHCIGNRQASRKDKIRRVTRKVLLVFILILRCTTNHLIDSNIRQI